jgi:colanic acid biosynthesis protein WcaH
MRLDQSTFANIIANTPLVSIDLLVQNTQGEFLLGFRNNRPAKDFWFVPGGRILKDERMQDAFKRLTMEELGIQCSIENAKFLGPYEHFYTDYVFGSEHSTHYVVLAYSLRLELALSDLPEQQHSQYRWFSANEMRERNDVHVHSSVYLDAIKA